MGPIEEIADIQEGTFTAFDAVIDVRSPDEFAADHIPGAINLPVLSNGERAEVGGIYIQESKFRARRVGAAYVAQNISQHLNSYFLDKPSDFRPLIYCWRGGMRSASMATILSRVGWRSCVLKGGYKTWRQKVVHEMRQPGERLNLVLLDGHTGTAKSDILHRLDKLGVQTIDLETLAAHRGSVFGALPGQAQPSQKLFESLLWDKIRHLNLRQPIVVEAESNRIGRCEIPIRLWQSMQLAPRVTLHTAPSARAQYLVTAYASLIAQTDMVRAAIDRLKSFHNSAQIEGWQIMAAQGDYHALAESLMHEHYDPLYARSRKRITSRPLGELKLKALDEANLNEAAKSLRNAIIQNYSLESADA